MIYCDTSLLVNALAKEERTAIAQQWLRDHADAQLCISAWVDTEFSSALAMKLRGGVIDAVERARILTQWRGIVTHVLTSIEVPAGAFALAARFIDREDVNLRASDALHVAVASLGGHSLATLDRTMAEAAVQVGVGVVPL